MHQDAKEIRLGDVISTKKGFAFKSKWYQNTGVAVVRVSDFTENSISTSQLNFIDVDIAKNFTDYRLRKWDIIVQTVGSWQHNPASIVGKVISVPENLEESLLNQNAVKLIPKEKINKRFLFYRLKVSDFKKHNLNHAQGAANQASITLDSIRKFQFHLPHLNIQKKIANILSAYDDLTENNLKRIKLLEEKAQLTYEEWFVRMKFPGHESVAINKETGLPEGWNLEFIGDVCEVSGGGTPSKSKNEYWENGDITWFSPTDLSKSNSLIQLDSSSKINELGLRKSSAKLLQPNSFMMTSRATIGLFGLIDKPFCTNQGFINVTPKKKVHKEYLLYNFKTNIGLFENFATGTTFLEISKSNLKRIKIYWPTENLIKQYHELVEPIHQVLFSLSKQNQLLKEARDILLPRLMTGMIDVEKLDMEEIKEQPMGMVAEEKSNHTFK